MVPASREEQTTAESLRPSRSAFYPGKCAAKILFLLYGGEKTQREIAGTAKVDLSLISRTLKKLEMRGLVTRRRVDSNHGNEKSMRYILTENGARFVNAFINLGQLTSLGLILVALPRDLLRTQD